MQGESLNKNTFERNSGVPQIQKQNMCGVAVVSRSNNNFIAPKSA